MGRPFLSLDAAERENIIRIASRVSGASPVILEKDIWLCWILETLFSMPDAHPMAFKGGTSLSKIHGVIDRFSEDVDISLDYRHFDGVFDPFAEGVSGSRIKRLGEHLKERVASYVRDVIAPYLEFVGDRFAIGDRYRIAVGDDGETLRFIYPSVVEDPGRYVGKEVLLEFGGRNVITPNERHTVRTDIARLIPDIDFPSATVTALSPERTFWEKVTLIHVECHRRRLADRANRMSRHWFDLACLATHPIGRTALRDRDLLEGVVRHKKVFFRAGNANYDRCLDGRLRLVPDADQLPALRSDYEKMVGAGVINAPAPEFDRIIERLHILEAEVNRLCGSGPDCPAEENVSGDGSQEVSPSGSGLV